MLTVQDKKVLLALEDTGDIQGLIEKTQLPEVAIMRSALTLQDNNLAEIHEHTEAVVDLTEEGEYLSQELPERKILNLFKEPDTLDVEDISIDPSEVTIALGWLKRKGLIDILKKDTSLTLKITERGREYQKMKLPEEEALDKIRSGMGGDTLSPEILKTLKSRKAVTIREKTQRKIILTEKGAQKIREGLELTEQISQVTPEVLRERKWTTIGFRPYDITADVRDIPYGKRHFVNRAIEYVRKIWLEMGFKEMKGPLVSSAFWNFDALFQPQDHPARDMQDTFFVAGKADLPENSLVERVKAMHEHGGDISSTGWKYQWDKKEAQKLVLRTHTTVLSARTLAEIKKSDLPLKFFSVGKVFRNEKPDWNHLAEFYQTDGIVVGEGVNLRNLLGYLARFLQKMGIQNFRFRPAYFPYTEPSVEAEVYNSRTKEWVELIGSGVFRPEVVVPLLGEDIPVLAWGPGFGRIIMDYYRITYLRDLYRNDLRQIRDLELWMW
ncbi:MAG: phenylalanine--tRNA ligase subunit alpha [Theionarchaea archaeon]|nr:phenylalanine--tRNA ligase subunit alpha [Theionarchaea archaeon]MBU7037975.1 phenylalanine--tRNA ligase subunit alpha [Theionarchaea archaeon]